MACEGARFCVSILVADHADLSVVVDDVCLEAIAHSAGSLLNCGFGYDGDDDGGCESVGAAIDFELNCRDAAETLRVHLTELAADDERILRLELIERNKPWLGAE